MSISDINVRPAWQLELDMKRTASLGCKRSALRLQQLLIERDIPFTSSFENSRMMRRLIVVKLDKIGVDELRVLSSGNILAGGEIFEEHEVEKLVDRLCASKAW